MKFIKHLLIYITLATAATISTSCDPENLKIPIERPDLDNENSGENDSDVEGDEGDNSGSSDEGNQGDQGEQNPENSEFVMLFTNDFHSQIEPTDDNKGGVLRLKALVDSVRTAEPHVLLADAGDLVQGTYYFSLLNGVVEMKMLDMLKYDIRTIGNHEFDKKMSGLGEMFALSKVPVVASNYDFSNTDLARYIVPSKILNAGRIKVGFIGLNVRLLNLVNKTACEGVEWQDAINVADQYAAQLRQQGADIVIAISHLGYGGGNTATYYDCGLVPHTQHIDMIIGGHSHTTLEKATYVTDADGDQVAIVQTGSRGYNLGYAKIRLDNNGKPSFSYRLIPVNSRLDNRVDPTFSGIINDYAAEVKGKMDVKLGYAPQDINRRTPESPLGNLSADGLIWAAKHFHNVDADVAVYNSGGVRANIAKGEVTLGDVYAAFPFDNALSILTITGKNLRYLMYKVPFDLYVNKEVRLVSNSDGWVSSITINGQQIDDNKTYTVATLDYISDNDAYTTILGKPIDREDSVEMIRDYFGEYFKYLAAQNNGYITASTDGRITIE